jgi:hypothetical protein
MSRPPNMRAQFGLLTRISIHPPAARASLYGIKTKGAFVDALPIRYDHARWMREFLSNWAPGSPGYDSYYGRIASGPAYQTERAKPAA